MNYSRIFSIAHAKTRSVMAAYGLTSYRAAFGVCLASEMKRAWAMEKAMAARAANDAFIASAMRNTGIFPQADGTFTVMTSVRSWSYKTRRSAEKKWSQIMAERQMTMF